MEVQLFVDGSCDPNSKVGYGAMLLAAADEDGPLEDLRGAVAVNRFEPCGSSSLELKVLLWALSRLGAGVCSVAVHTDSQTIVGLPRRRASLEAADFRARSGRPLGQAQLYRDFYDALDARELGFVKQKGHGPAGGKSREALLFSFVDKAARAALRAGRV